MNLILIIEDNHLFLDNLSEGLEIEGYRVISAGNGRIGFESAREFIPDLIICDMMLPLLTGIEVLALILTTPLTSRIPFIFSTSQSEKNDYVKAINLGADAYFIKPYDMDVLLERVNELIISGSKRTQQ